MSKLARFVRSNKNILSIVLLGLFCAFVFSTMASRSVRKSQDIADLEKVESQARAYEGLLTYHLDRLSDIVGSWASRDDFYTSVTSGKTDCIFNQFTMGVYSDLSLFAIIVKEPGKKELYGAKYDLESGVLAPITDDMRVLATKFDAFALKAKTGFVFYHGDVYFAAVSPICKTDRGGQPKAAVIALQRYQGTIENSMENALTAHVHILGNDTPSNTMAPRLLAGDEHLTILRVVPDIFDQQTIMLTTTIDRESSKFSYVIGISYVVAFLLASIILVIYTISVIVCLRDHREQRLTDAYARYTAKKSASVASGTST